MKAYYFGTYLRPGHYLWTEGLSKLRVPHRYGPDANPERPWDPLPWQHVDGKLHPPRGRQGEAALHHLDGWTALAFVNYTDDERGGSNSAFFFDATLDFDEALAAARQRFPGVVGRFDFEIVDSSEPEGAAPSAAPSGDMSEGFGGSNG